MAICYGKNLTLEQQTLNALALPAKCENSNLENYYRKNLRRLNLAMVVMPVFSDQCCDT